MLPLLFLAVPAAILDYERCHAATWSLSIDFPLLLPALPAAICSINSP